MERLVTKALKKISSLISLVTSSAHISSTMLPVRMLPPTETVIVPEIEAHELCDIWFQQDGATSYTWHQILDPSREHFSEQMISRYGVWPPRSYDITP